MKNRIELRGVNWGHRRATRPLQAATDAFHAANPSVGIAWDVRPLSDFEHEGIAGAAKRYDFVVFDHPFCGDIVRSGCFLELGALLPEVLGPEAIRRYIGPSLETYRYGGGLWGAPIDGATQHALVRPDLLDGEPAPRSWDEALALGRRLRTRGKHLGMAFASPHAILAAGSLMANAGAPWSTDPAAPFTIDEQALEAALAALVELAALCLADAIGWNSIDLHEAMVERDDIAFCPCVYGYATYGEPLARRRLAFAPFAGTREPFGGASAVGGAALGVSARTREKQAAIAFIAHCLDPAQARLAARHCGQPALLEAWRDPEIDRHFNGYFSQVAPSMELAWVRPRLPGYPAFQAAAGSVAQEVVAGKLSGKAGASKICELARALDRGA